eukprot:4628625-Ditylum_brightwellii.AAC.1
MLRAEKNYRKAKEGHLWSLKLVEAARRVSYWRTRKSDTINNREASAFLLSLGKSQSIVFNSLSVPILASKLTATRKALRTAQQHAAALRD